MEYDPERITYFAKADARGKNVEFGIKAKDRTRHVYVIGKTGMGKSTMLENMAVQDIQNGEGMAFIDPHGSTAETLLDYIPEERKDDVLYFAPFDMDYPVSFNVMEDVGADKRHLVVSGLMSTFKKIWVDAWSARMEYILSNTLLALLEYPDSTLLGVNRMLSDKVYRKKVIDNITDPAVKSFWVDEFLKYNERYMQEAGDAIKNKIGQFTANPLIRNIIGQPKSSFNVREMMDNKKILIMNLSKGLIGETNANLLGSMLITRIYLDAMSRADLSPAEMKNMSNFYFYVDEFQSFANEAFANILSEARKYKLNLTIAHQYIEQMEEEVRNAVFGNVGTTISFRVGPFDAEVLETIFQPQFYAVDICNLGFAQVYLSLMIDGVGSQPFSATTLPPIEPTSVSCKDMIVHSSRTQFTHTRTEVEEAITEWHEPDIPPHNNNTQNPNNRGKNNNHNNSYNSNDKDNTKPPYVKKEISRENGGSQNDGLAQFTPKKSGAQHEHKKERGDNAQRGAAPYEKKREYNTNSQKNGGSYEKKNERSNGPQPHEKNGSSNNGHSNNKSHYKKQHNLDELRGVLKSLSQNEGEKRTEYKKKEIPSQVQPAESVDPDKKIEHKKTEMTQKKPDTTSVTDLKNELKSVLRDNGDKTVKDKKKFATEDKKRETGPNTHIQKEVRDNQRTEVRRSTTVEKTQHIPQKESVHPRREFSVEKRLEQNQGIQKQDDGHHEQKEVMKPAETTTQSQRVVKEKPVQKRNSLNPKELERMMRVTTSDKTPLK